MPTKSYMPISAFWYLGVPAVLIGLGYFLWNSHSFVATQIRWVLGPLVSYVGQLFSGLL